MKKNKKLISSILALVLAGAALLIFGEEALDLFPQLYGEFPSYSDTSAQTQSFENTASMRQQFTNSGLSVCVISIGQADSILIRQEDAVMLIDCGESDDADTILDTLDALDIEAIDTLVLTHPHADHIGGARKVIEEIPVAQIYIPNVASDTQTFDKLLDIILEKEIPTQAASAGMSIPFGNTKTTVLSPPSDLDSDEMNLYSIVLRIEYDGIKMLFTGDAEDTNEDMILSSGENIHCDLIKIGHHGSNTSSGEGFVYAVDADWAIATTEYNSKDNLPKEDILSRWTSSGAQVLCTHLYGNVYAFVNDGQLAVYTEKQPTAEN